jgi:hypothetical protein
LARTQGLLQGGFAVRKEQSNPYRHEQIGSGEIVLYCRIGNTRVLVILVQFMKSFLRMVGQELPRRRHDDVWLTGSKYGTPCAMPSDAKPPCVIALG